MPRPQPAGPPQRNQQQTVAFPTVKSRGEGEETDGTESKFIIKVLFPALHLSPFRCYTRQTQAMPEKHLNPSYPCAGFLDLAPGTEMY